MEEQCKKCKFFGPFAQCRRYPPSVDFKTDNDQFPIVKEDWWCGEFKYKEPVNEFLRKGRGSE